MPSIMPAVVFALLAMFTGFQGFFIFSVFFLVQYFMGRQKMQNQSRQRSTPQRRTRTNRTRQRPHQEEPRRPVQRAAQRPRMSSRANPFKRTGIQKYKEFDLEAAIDDFNKGLEIEPRDIALHFNIACAYSLTEQKEKAYLHIKKAVENGLQDLNRVQTHDDLAYVRIQPEYEAFKESGYRQYAFTSEDGQVIDDGTETVADDVLLSQLNKLAEMRKKGLLSESEFVLERKKLLRT